MSKVFSLVLAFLLAASSAFTSVEIALSPQTTYIVNTNTDRFHSTRCKHVDRIKEKNKWEYTGTREYLIEFGYVPCKGCNP